MQRGCAFASDEQAAAAVPPVDAATANTGNAVIRSRGCFRAQDSGAVAANELTPAGATESGAYKAAYDLFKNGEYAGCNRAI
jgi:TolA-binding protein